MEKRIRISGMSCQHCVAAVRKALEGLKGLSRVQVDLEKGEARFDLGEGGSMDQVRRAVEEAGYQVET
jgi:copper ion binding protein